MGFAYASYCRSLFHSDLSSYKKTLDKIGARIESLMGKKITAPGGMVNLIIPIYANHFTHEEIKNLSVNNVYFQFDLP